MGLRNLPIKTVIDIGANTGQFAKMILSVFPKAHIYCFEVMILDFRKLIKSFGYAINGLKIVLQEQTFRIFCFIAILVIILMFLLEVSFYEKLILILTITFLITFELINSRIEEILDVFQPNNDPKVKVIKDITAGAVFLASLGAAMIGILIFLPRILKIFF